MNPQPTFRKQLLRLVIPITLQQLLMSLVSISDAVMLGWLSQDALSAVSLAGQVQFVYSLFLFALMSGVSIFAAQYWGIRRPDVIEQFLGIGLRWGILVSVPFTLGAMICPEWLMRCFASDPVLITYGAEYLRAVALSYLLLSISQMYLVIMKNCGMAAQSSVISLISVLVNLVMNALLIFGLAGFPKLGIPGAAIATVLSKLIELILVLLVMRKPNSVKIRLPHILHIDANRHREYWKYSLPMFGNQLVWGLGFTMYSVILGHMGSDAAAANSIANIVKNLVICVCTGIAGASGVLVGTELGQGHLDTAKAYGKKLCHVSLIGGILSGLVILAVIPFVKLFGTLSDTACDYLRTMLVVCAYYVVGKAMNMTTISGIFPAGGDAKFGLRCDAVTMWFVTVPIGLISAFVLHLPVEAVYILINIDEIVKLPAVYKHYKQYAWLHTLTEQDTNHEACAVPSAQ